VGGRPAAGCGARLRLTAAGGRRRRARGDGQGHHAGADGSAEENIALHKAVVQKLADNGGQAPDSLRG
jgi:hypothetical protein